MKKFNYLSLAVSILLLTSCPGEVIVDPDDPKDPKEALLKQKIEALVSPDLMKAIKGLGMPIHDGTNPPNIEGKYLADDQTMKKTNFEEDDPPGTKYEDEVLTISGQNNDNFSVTLKSETDTYTQTFSMIISGSGDRFTLYAPMDIQLDDNTRVKAVLLYSGKMKEGELHDLYSGTFISDKSYFGLGQIFYEADGVAKKTDGNTSEVIEATGETATGSYKGKDMVLKFPSNLQISIKAAKNKDAPHEEISITEREEMEMFNLGKQIILDFSKMTSAYTIDVETVVDKGLNAEEDIDCSLFTTDRQAVEAANGRIYKKVDFTYNKTTGKLTLSLQANAPFNPTKSGTSSQGGKYGYLAIATTPDYNFETETVTMKAPYVEQVSETCWAACAMMFVRSYKNLDPKQDNSLFKLVKEVGHTTLDEGWGTNFITFWSYDTKSIVKAIRERIGGDVNISCSSFRRTKSAAVEMVKLLRKRHPVILNHGTHVLYVIGYRKGENAGATSFLVHDPQGMSGDMYKWIVWDQYLKQVKFNEAWVQGDAIYIIYADKPMLANPVLQTMAIPAADTQNKMCPTGADLTFTMKAYGKGRKVFPKYDHEEFTGIGWGKSGYGEQNADNDTLYSPTQLNVEMRVYNADDNPSSMQLDMDIGGGTFKYYSASFTCPAKGVYTVKGSHFEDSSGKQFDPSLSDFFKVPGDKDLYLEFSLRNVWGDENIEEFDYYGLVTKSQPGKGIVLTTAKTVGETIELQIITSDLSQAWIDLNNNGKKDAGEETSGSKKTYTLGAQTIRIHGAVAYLYCANNQLTSLDASDCTTLGVLWCNDNQLTSLNVNGCTALESLRCDNNRFTSLDVSGCTALKELSYCEQNQLTSLNVSGCTALQSLSCHRNQISSLNVSGCTALQSLSCHNNKITSLDVSGFKALQNLSCYNNQITSLDVSGFKALQRLSCYNNQLTSLNVNGCTALKDLSCSSNRLTSLNVSGCTALQELYCNGNQLTSLSVQNCTKLNSLYCGENKLTSLNVSGLKLLELLTIKQSSLLTSLDASGCIALRSFDCSGENLTSLNVSGCTTLKELKCSKNKLTSLNISGCTALEILYCNRNQLTSINVGGSKALRQLDCYSNQLTSLNMSGFTALELLDCYDNRLTSLNVSGCTALRTLYCSSNNICEVRPAIFDNIETLSYDIRYKYKWDYDQKKYVVDIDHGKGYWYAHEPGGGCHRPDPCNK